jgi:MFS family permease
MGRSFRRLWAAFAISTAGTWLGFGAFPLIAIRVFHSGPAEISALAAASTAAGAVLAMPLGPWVEARRKRTVMIAADVLRFAALVSVPLGYAAGRLTYPQLVVVSTISTAANIAFTAASDAYLKDLVAPDHLLRANARFESTAWTAIAIGPALGRSSAPG